MNKLTVDERIQEIIAYAKGQGLEGIELFDRVEALGGYLDESSKGNEKPANRRPRAETRSRLMLIGTGL